jgi:spermidine synthase
MNIFGQLIKKKNMPTFLLASSMFFTGASGLIVQNILIMSASNILGNTIAQVAITVAIMLGFMGIGGTYQKYIKTNLLAKFATIEVILAIMTGFAPIALYATYAVMPEHFELIQYVWIASIGFLMGLEIPIISRLNEEFQPDLKDNLASVITMDYIGSMVGGGIWVWLFLGKVDLSSSAFITASMNLFVAVITFFYFSKRKNKSVIKMSMAIMVAVGAMVFGYTHADSWEKSLQQKLYEDPIVFHKRTKYQDLTATKDKKIDDYRLYINGNLQFSTTDEKIYHEFLIHPVMEVSKSKKNILVLGGGDGMAVRELLKYDEVESITLVDLDKEMIDIFTNDPIMSKLNGGSFKDARVTTSSPTSIKAGKRAIILTDDNNKKIKDGYVDVFIVDAFSFVQKSKDKLYDVVIIDFPDPSMSELSKLYSKEFYIHLHNVLSPDAVMTVQSTSPFHAKESFLCVGRTFESAGYKTIPFHHNVPSFGDWGWYLVWPGCVEEKEMKEKFTSIEKFNVPLSYITPELVTASVFFGKGYLDAEKDGVNTLMNPVLLTYYLNDSWKIE